MKKQSIILLFAAIFMVPSVIFAQYYPYGYGTTSSETNQAVFGGTATVTNAQTVSATSDGEGKESTCIDLKSEKLGFGSTDTETSGEVSAVQDFLIFKGLLDGSPTGYYGFKTYRAVLNYQKSKNIDQVGRVGPLTKKFIKEDSCGVVISSSSSSVVSSATVSSAAWGGSPTVTNQSLSQSGCTYGSSCSSSGVPSGFPYIFNNQTTANGGYLSRIKMSLRGSSSKILGSSLLACTKSVGSDGCVSDNSFTRVKEQPGWTYVTASDMYLIDRDVTYDKLPNVEYISIIKTFDNQRYEIKWRATASATSASQTTSSSSNYQGAVFGAGSSGIPNSQPITYSWVGYAGPVLGQQSPSNLGFSEPSTPCTQSNAGATYYLGKSSSGTDVVATCTASNQSVTGAASVSNTTLNVVTESNSQASFGGTATVKSDVNSSSNTKSQASFGPSYSYVGGTFKSGDQTIEWSCGNAGAPAPEGSGWVTQESGCYHRVAQ